MEKDMMMECFPLYKVDSTTFSGYDPEVSKNIVGIYNTGKVNYKEPDLRLYYVNDKGIREERDFLSLWLKMSKNDRPYYIGYKDGFKYIGLIRFNNMSEEDPYMSIYFVMNYKKGDVKN